MKIIGGQYRGRNFYRPQGIRPTQSVTREALFDLIGHDMAGIAFLDLFAGSGAVGIEALSRGARQVTFVEKDSRCAQVIRENLGLLMVPEQGGEGPWPNVLMTDAFAAVKFFSRQELKFDIIYADPPYGRGLAKKALKTLEAYDILQPNYILIIQHSKREILPERQGRFLLFRQKKYGNSNLSIYKQDKPLRSD